MVAMFPINVEEALKSGVYCSGTTGSGKSDVGMYIADKLKKHDPKIVIIVFDPSQDWMERSSIPAFTRPVLDKWLWGDPLQWQNMQSTVFDLSQMAIQDQQSLVEDFCKQLMEWQASIPKTERRQWFIIFEEAHTYFPQGCMTAKRYKNTVRMMTQGRNFKVRFMCITQFAAMIDKNAMRYMRQRYFGFTDEPNDANYVANMLPKTELKWQKLLMLLKTGHFIYKFGDSCETIQIALYPPQKQHKLVEWQPAHTQPQIAEQPTTVSKQSPQTNYATTKAIAIGIIGLIFLWLTVGAR